MNPAASHPSSEAAPSDGSSVFLNVPYDRRFGNLYLAYIAGVAAFRLMPRATLEIPGGMRRLDRILNLIGSCSYSIHDLSRVQLDRRPPATPRFNMPFELGLAVGWVSRSPLIAGRQVGAWFVFETMNRRLEKSLSDLNGTDVYIHEGTPEGIFRQLRNAFVHREEQPTIEQMRVIHQELKDLSRKIRHEAGAQSVFEASVFKQLVAVSQSLARLHLGIG